MRADTLRSITHSDRWEQLDTDEGFRESSRIWKSMAFRLKSGPLVRQINRNIVQRTEGEQYDLVWVDKGVYLWRETVEHLRGRASRMVHFTADTAFQGNRSRHFYAAARKYDLLVTTKSFELENYRAIADDREVMFVTQAFDTTVHRPVNSAHEKAPVAVFIGLCEPDRERCVRALLSAGVPVRIGGRGWKKFVGRYAHHPGLHFLGSEVFGERYAREYASATVGLGLLSTRFPELHTTRTFEIPACGTLLATKRTDETEGFFEEDEVVFFENYDELALRLHELLKNPERVDQMAQKGRQRVTAMGCDYQSVLTAVLNRIQIPVSQHPKSNPIDPVTRTAGGWE